MIKKNSNKHVVDAFAVNATRAWLFYHEAWQAFCLEYVQTDHGTSNDRSYASKQGKNYNELA